MQRTSSTVLSILSISGGVAMIGIGIIWPLMPVYAVELGAGGFVLDLIIAGFNIARTVFNPIAGRISDRRGKKNLLPQANYKCE